MSGFETTSIVVPYGRRCEDRVKVVDLGEGVVIVVADGAGGSAAGDQAAEMVIREAMAEADLEHDDEAWREILQQVDSRIGAGETTGVVACWSARGIVGACVGDSQAWLIADGELYDLTKHRVRKPLLGSGAAVATGFSRAADRGLLIVATDGFCNYVKRESLLKKVLWTDFALLPRELVEMVRLPSGDLWDDIGIVACRPRQRPLMEPRFGDLCPDFVP